MLRDSGEHPVTLREAVTSPAGTTINAIREMENHGVRAAMLAALEAARDRGRELAAGGEDVTGSREHAGRPGPRGPAARAALRPRRDAGRLGLPARDRLAGGADRVRHPAVGVAHPPPDRHERRAVHRRAAARDRRGAATTTRRSGCAPRTPRPTCGGADPSSRCPGLASCSHHLHDRGVPFAIATSGARRTARSGAASMLGLPDDVPVVTRDLVERAKPDPHLFLAAARRLGVAPGELLRRRRQRVGPAGRPAGGRAGHRPALRRLRPRGAGALRRLPRLRRPRRDAHPPRGGRRPPGR